MKRQSPKAPFKRCAYCNIRFKANKTPCLLCMRDFEIDEQLKRRKVATYTPVEQTGPYWMTLDDFDELVSLLGRTA